MADNKYDALKLENQLCFPLYAAAKEVVRKYRPYLHALDLNYIQYIAMMVLWEHKSASVKELGKKLYLDSGSLTPVLKSLEAKGYVRRFRSKDDERTLLVEITQEGEDLKDAALLVPNTVSKFTKLDVEDAAQLYRILYKILSYEHN